MASNDHNMFSNTIGDTVNNIVKKTDLYCCVNAHHKKCSKKHKYMYQFTNCDKYLLTCGVIGHRKKMIEKCVKGNVANVYRLLHSYNAEDDEENEKCVYTVVGVSVDTSCDTEYPLINHSLKMSTLKQMLQTSKNSEHTNEMETREHIRNVCSLLEGFNAKLSLHKASQNEISKTLKYIESHTHYQPSNLKITNIGDDVCSICQEELKEDDSRKLYECSHSFHSDCIKRWFESKETITCPCCREECDYDKYFIFSKKNN